MPITKNVPLQVKDIIRNIDALSYIAIEQLDVFLSGTPREDESEEIYRGTVLDIPWYIMDYYLANTADSEAIGAFIMRFNDGRNPAPALCLTVVADKDRLDLRYN